MATADTQTDLELRGPSPDVDTSISQKHVDQMPEAVRNNMILRRKIWPRMHVRRSNWMAIVVGEPGDGKSYASLRLAEAVNPEFCIDDVAWNVAELMQIASDKSYPTGHITVLEEGGIAAGNREWWENANKALDQLTQTWRHQRRGLIVTVPDLDLVDSHVRRRFHHYIEMVGVDEDAGIARAKCQWMDTDHKRGKIYYKYHRMQDARGVTKKYKYLDFRLPSEHVVGPYEEQKDAFTTGLNQSLLDSLTADLDVEELSPQEVVDEVVENGSIDSYISESPGGEYLDRDMLKFDFGLSESESKLVKKLLVREMNLDVM